MSTRRFGWAVSSRSAIRKWESEGKKFTGRNYYKSLAPCSPWSFACTISRSFDCSMRNSSFLWWLPDVRLKPFIASIMNCMRVSYNKYCGKVIEIRISIVFYSILIECLTVHERPGVMSTRRFGWAVSKRSERKKFSDESFYCTWRINRKQNLSLDV